MNKSMKPESLMMSYGYKPELSEGAIKCPIFLTSTFVFKSAEEGKAYFELAYGKREKLPGEEMGLIYSRINNPDLEILENRLRLWDGADDCAVFESGMSAISTVLLEFLKPGDLLVHSSPTYGGTDHFINHFLPKIGVHTLGFTSEMSEEDLVKAIEETGHASTFAHMHLETPANPTNSLIDIEMCRRVADRFVTDEKPVTIAVDNTYMGPLWQHPLKHGADLVMYSATKYIGGHSDLIAGAVLGNAENMVRVKTLRTFLGNMASPHTGWMLLRSLETLKIRMEAMQENAIKVAEFLSKHDKVASIKYLGLLEEGTENHRIYKQQCSGPGAMVSFKIKGGEKEAFKFLNSLQLVKLAVSLGGTESLAEHPKTMTHAGVDEAHLEAIGVTDALIRISVGVENYEDLIWDIGQALDQVTINVIETA
ncbi:methionine gamma-lyase [Nonlabens sp. MIC269]|uniref:cystathionine gamma-synthase family protein n=1 Tax=Nonlabens sp. MIC269 TaxID=1476901 RepID=UPI00071FBC49|nr:cystathionine gamma-synthase family protein [Nonlabens sp. MIC269]ALM21246.1 methionine gamma-lyase [Nonlabens sp. MIC269]